MRCPSLPLLLLLLAGSARAQNLLNAGFEYVQPVSPFVPPLHWQSQPANGLRFDFDGAVRFNGCGTKSVKCRPQVAAAALVKQWTVTPAAAIVPGDTVTGRFRVQWNNLAPPPGAQLQVRAWAVLAAAPGTPFGTAESEVILPTAPGTFVDRTVSYVVPTGIPASGIVVRIGVVFAGMVGQSVWVDENSFRWSSPSFGSIEVPPCPEPYQLESDAFSLELDPVRFDLRSLRDRSDYAELLGASGSSLFTLQRVDPTTLAKSRLDTSHFATASATEFLAGTLRRLTIRHQGWTLGGSATVTVVVEADRATPGIRFALEFDNATSEIVDRALAPELKLAHLKDAAGNIAGKLFCPHQNGIELDAAQFPTQNVSKFADYPGLASMQYAAYYGDARGVAVMGRDLLGEPKQVGFSHVTGATPHVELRVAHYNGFAGGDDIAAAEAFPVELMPCSGTWMAAARTYREWAHGAWWVTSASAAAPPPARVVFNANHRPEGVGVHLVPNAAWPALMNTWAGMFGGAAGGQRMQLLSRSFERYGTYILPFATPLDDELALSQSWNQLLLAGHGTMAMVAGLKWMQQRNAWYPAPPSNPCVSPAPTPCPWGYWVEPFSGLVNDSGVMKIGFDGGLPFFCSYPGGTAQFSPPGDDVCAVDANGVVADIDGQANATWDGLNSRMCPGHAFSTCVHAYLAAYLATKGVRDYEFDQLNGGGPYLCYSTAANHGHAPGYGRWMFERTYALMAATRSAGRAVAPDFSLSLEDPGELYLPLVDAVWTAPHDVASFNFTNGALSAVLPIVPAFQYVYGDVVTTIARTEALQTKGITFQDPKPAMILLSRMVTTGCWLSIEVPAWMMLRERYPNTDCSCPPTIAPGSLAPLPSDLNVDQAALLQNLALARRGIAGPYLDLGRMVSTEPLGIGSPSHTWTDAGCNCAVSAPVVNHAAWQSPLGDTALILASAEGSGSASINVTAPTGFDGRPVPPGTAGWITRINNGVAVTASFASYPAGAALTLAPLEVVIVEVDPY